MNIIIINGPNLNLLGTREKELYGETSFDDYFLYLKKKYSNLNLSYYQSNVEGELVDKIQEVGYTYDGIIINPGGYTHTSVAILDVIKSITTPVVEAHLSNIYSREEFRQKSLLTPFCIGCIVGFGLDSYRLSINNIINR